MDGEFVMWREDSTRMKSKQVRTSKNRWIYLTGLLDKFERCVELSSRLDAHMWMEKGQEQSFILFNSRVNHMHHELNKEMNRLTVESLNQSLNIRQKKDNKNGIPDISIKGS